MVDARVSFGGAGPARPRRAERLPLLHGDRKDARERHSTASASTAPAARASPGGRTHGRSSPRRPVLRGHVVRRRHPPRLWVSSQDGRSASPSTTTPPPDPRFRAGHDEWVEVKARTARRSTHRSSSLPPSTRRALPVVVRIYGARTGRRWQTRDAVSPFEHLLSSHGFLVCRSTTGAWPRAAPTSSRGPPRPRPGRARGPARRRRAPEVAAVRGPRANRDHGRLLRRLHDPLRAHPRPDVFRAGVAISSVTDWKHYDSIYTERYMGRPRPTRRLRDELAPGEGRRAEGRPAADPRLGRRERPPRQHAVLRRRLIRRASPIPCSSTRARATASARRRTASRGRATLAHFERTLQ